MFDTGGLQKLAGGMMHSCLNGEQVGGCSLVLRGVWSTPSSALGMWTVFQLGHAVLHPNCCEAVVPSYLLVSGEGN